MLTKLKYVGTSTEDVLDIYIKYIRSLLDYCAVVRHSTLTAHQSDNLEHIHKVCLRVILGEGYTNYKDALKIRKLEKLAVRRESRSLNFGLKSLLHPKHCELFPVSPHVLNSTASLNREHFQVNWARTESYKKSTVPYIQRQRNASESERLVL